jgi:hypothetical protein
MWNFAHGMGHFLDRTTVFSDVDVRQGIEKNGIELPPASWNLFYAFNGFPDHNVWITFTVPRDQLWRVVETSLHKKKEDFTSGLPQGFWDQVQMAEDQKADTSLWAPRSIKNPVYLSIRRDNSHDTWVVDEEGGRVFVTRMGT